MCLWSASSTLWVHTQQQTRPLGLYDDKCSHMLVFIWETGVLTLCITKKFLQKDYICEKLLYTKKSLLVRITAVCLYIFKFKINNAWFGLGASDRINNNKGRKT